MYPKSNRAPTERHAKLELDNFWQSNQPLEKSKFDDIWQPYQLASKESLHAACSPSKTEPER